MKPESSSELFQKYFNLKNRLIEIELKNHKIFRGKFIGYFKENEDTIAKWHFTDVDTLLGSDPFGIVIGQLIKHEDILKVRFMEDNSIMYLK